MEDIRHRLINEFVGVDDDLYYLVYYGVDNRGSNMLKVYHSIVNAIVSRVFTE